jgi:hypothetical protein
MCRARIFEWQDRTDPRSYLSTLQQHVQVLQATRRHVRVEESYLQIGLLWQWTRRRYGNHSTALLQSVEAAFQYAGADHVKNHIHRRREALEKGRVTLNDVGGAQVAKNLLILFARDRHYVQPGIQRHLHYVCAYIPGRTQDHYCLA